MLAAGMQIEFTVHVMQNFIQNILAISMQVDWKQKLQN